jgi:uncharacterized Ntn-hydrolase superfamily protein
MKEAGNSQHLFAGNLAYTFSIVARDPNTGEMGVAVQSHWFSAGSIVSWAEAGVGAIATQSFVNASFGPEGLERLRTGQAAPQVVEELIAVDEGRAFRQLAVVDAQGNVAAYTGQKCVAEAGHYCGDNFSVQANMMLNDQVWPAMAQAFESSQEPLAERLVTALSAGQAAGGDIRGQQSAAILVVRGQSTGRIWKDRLIDLRVEDHPEPIKELKRLLQVFRAYEYMNEGDACLEKNDVEGALAAYRTARAIQPDNLEIKFWYAVTLVNANRVSEALPMFEAIFAEDGDWSSILRRIAKVGLLQISPADLEKISRL